ncbi:MAG: dioxygenase [Myxococcaceae bacterium]|nr:dioxygenase [Myxococcaceae bacterium]
MSNEEGNNGFTRREVTVAGAAGLTGLATASSSSKGTAAAVRSRMPVVFVPHGGGPWPFVDMGGMASMRDIASLRAYFVGLPKSLPTKPKALLVISAHWEEAVPTVMTSSKPPLFYDYGGFPPEAYTLTWPALGDPLLAQRVVGLLEAGGMAAKTDERRGYDHGTFIPFKLSWPAADIPTIQLSLKRNYDPAEHLAMGRALAPLRDEGVLIAGSGMSFHSFRSWRMGTARQDSQAFDTWLQESVTGSPLRRTERLTAWESAPGGRVAHPHEDHLVPLMVVAGAAGDDVGRIAYSDEFMAARITAVHFG